MNYFKDLFKKILINKHTKSIYTNKFIRKLMYIIPFTSGICLFTCNQVCGARCPYNEITDPYPGLCRRYVDENGNGNCDLASGELSTHTNNINETNNQGLNHHSEHNGFDIINNQQNNGENYFPIPITLIVLFIYLITYFLYKKNIINRKKHYKFWNIILSFAMLGSGLTGLILILAINLSKKFISDFLLFYHVEISIIMFAVTLVHIIMYRKQIKRILHI